jgi:choline-sulfatase
MAARTLTRVLSATFLALLVPGAATGAPPERKSLPPSIVLITLDTVRADHIGCYGYRTAETPALDGLARDGTRFANAYTVVPITLPSHAAILTGTYPMWNGVRDFTSPGLRGTVPALAEILKRRGLSTAAFISSYALNSMRGLNRGFEVYDDQMNLGAGSSRDLFLATRPGDTTTIRMLEWLDRHRDKPFFVWLHLYDAHSPYRSPEPYASRHAALPYDGAIAFDDAQVGRAMSALRRDGLYDSSLIVVTSDHGESLGEHGEAQHGFFVYNSTLLVPLIVKWPGGRDSGRVVAQPVSTIDIASTIAQAAGVPDSDQHNFQGESLARWTGPGVASTAKQALVYSESYYARDSFGWHELRALVDRQYKYIDAPEPELYDVEHDAGELSNIIANHEAVAGSMRTKLKELERRHTNETASTGTHPLDSETLEALRSLGYVAYQAAPAAPRGATALEDPKQKIATFNDILRAGDLRRTGQHGEAAKLLAELKSREPALNVLPFEAGENDLAWGKPQDAVSEFRAAVQLNPHFDQALLGLGRACFELKQDPEAATALELALHLGPHNFLARLALASVYLREGAADKAETELARVVADQPQFAEGHAEYGMVLARRKAYADAVREIERSLELGYRDAGSLNSLGISRAQLGQHEAALEAYQQALQLDPRSAAACLNLAIEHRRAGEAAEAQRYYRKTCELSDQLCRQYASQFAPN